MLGFLCHRGGPTTCYASGSTEMGGSLRIFVSTGRPRPVLGLVLLAIPLVVAAAGAEDLPPYLLLVKANEGIEAAVAARVRNDGAAAHTVLETAREAAELLADDHGLPLARTRLAQVESWSQEAATRAVETWAQLTDLEGESVLADPERISSVLETCRDVGDRWCEARAHLARAEALAEGSLPQSVREDSAAAEAIFREAGPSEWLGRTLVLRRGSGVGGGEAAIRKALERYEEAIGMAAMAGSPSLEGRALCERVRVHLDQENFEAARADLERMREIAASAEAPRVAACGGYREGFLLYLQGNQAAGAERWKRIADSEAVVKAPREALWNLIGVTAIAINSGNGAEALRWARKAVQVADGLHGSDDRGRAFCNLTTALIIQGILGEAESAAGTCLESSRAHGVKNGEEIGLRGLAIAARSRGDTDEALGLLRQSLAITKEHRIPQDSLWNLLSIGIILRDQGDLEGARAHFEQARQIADWLKRPDVRAITRSNLGVVLVRLGEIETAEQLVNEALSIPSWDGSPALRPWALRTRGLIRTYRQDFAAALPDYRQAYQIFHAREQPGNQADLAIDIGNVYYRLFRTDRALEFYERARAPAETAGNTQARLVADGNIALLKKRAGSFESALESMREVIEEAESSGLISLALHQSINLADTMAQMGRLEEAERASRQALEWALGSGDPAGLVYSRTSLAHILSEAGKHQDALRLCQKHLGQASIADPHLQMDVRWACGWVHLRAGDAARAVEEFRAAIRIGEEPSRRLGQTELGTSFRADRVAIYADLVQALIAGAENESPALVEEIFQISESFRARVLLESLASMTGKPAVAGDSAGTGTDEPSSRAQLLGRMAAIHLGFAEGRVEQDRFLDEVRRLEDLLAETGAAGGASSLLGAGPIALHRAQAAIPDASTAVLEYLLGVESSFVLVITRERAMVAELGRSRRDFFQLITRYRSLLESRSAQPERDLEAIRRLGGQLFENLVAPALAALEAEIRRLVVVADGALYLLPFEALVIPDESARAGPRFLVEQFEVAVVPSLSVLGELASAEGPNRAERSFVALANPRISGAVPVDSDGEDILREALVPTDLPPLPYSEEEVRNAARRLGGEKLIFKEAEATEANARRALQGGYPVVHFATHGFLDPGSIGRSGLVLTPDPPNGDDGLLQARELFDLRIDTDLVVLSGCSTGVGRILGGEGALGLPHSLFQAGVPSIVLSLWDVRDRAAAVFMDRFYAGIADGLTLAEAMRTAKLDLLRSGRPELRHPSVWAPFVLSGVFDRSLDLPRRTLVDRIRSSRGILGGTLVATLSMGALIWWRMRRRSRNAR